jgi:acetyl esterase/lipase
MARVSTTRTAALVVVANALLLLAVVACGSSSGPDVAAGAPSSGCARGQDVHHDLRYEAVPHDTSPKLVSLDVYAPVRDATCPPAPVLVFVHGGGWQRGDKAAPGDLGAKADLARAQGWLLVSVNYRLAPVVKWPAFDDDVAEAVAWVHRYAAVYGGDPSWIVLMGHSAGATIAASVAIDARHLQRAGGQLAWIRCAIPVDSSYDVVTDAPANPATYVTAFGSRPAGWADASPLRHIRAGAGIPRFLVITRGLAAWKANARRLVHHLRASGVRARLLDAGPTITHDQVNRWIGATGEQVETPAVVAFVRSCRP